MIKGLRSPFALVLSGTPLENRLDELYCVVQFIDDRRLAPAFPPVTRDRRAELRQAERALAGPGRGGKK